MEPKRDSGCGQVIYRFVLDKFPFKELTDYCVELRKGQLALLGPGSR